MILSRSTVARPIRQFHTTFARNFASDPLETKTSDQNGNTHPELYSEKLESIFQQLHLTTKHFLIALKLMLPPSLMNMVHWRILKLLAYCTPSLSITVLMHREFLDTRFWNSAHTKELLGNHLWKWKGLDRLILTPGTIRPVFLDLVNREWRTEELIKPGAKMGPWEIKEKQKREAETKTEANAEKISKSTDQLESNESELHTDSSNSSLQHTDIISTTDIVLCCWRLTTKSIQMLSSQNEPNPLLFNSLLPRRSLLVLLFPRTFQLIL